MVPLTVLAALLGLAPEAAIAVRGELTQLSGALGCVSVSGGQCARGRAIGEPYDVAVSPDGRHAYVASVKHNAIAVFARGRGGALRQLRGTRGCIRHRGGLGCARGRALADPWQVRMSPDGRNVYAASRTSHVLAVFRRDRRTGALRQLPGAAGCLSQFGGSGCGRARAIAGAAAIRVSPDGANVYVASVGSDAVAVFRRRPSNGALDQLPGASGCVSRAGGGGCARGRALDNAIDAALSRDGRHVYIASARSNGIAIFSRGPHGALVQAPGPDGCISQAGEDGCASGRTLRELLSVVVSPDGDQVYAGAAGAVGVLMRDPATGSLVQPAGALGCVSEAAQGCDRARSAHDVTWITLSPSGAHLYLASFGRVTVGAFSRSLGSGALDELAGRAGCAGPVSYLGCRRARSVRNILSLTVSPDGRNLYTASTGSNAVAVFRRAR